MPSASGKCLCGAVKFKVDEVHTNHSACHCGMCRKWSGGSPFFGVRTKGVSFEGEENIGRYSSSDWAERGFCKSCGTALFYYLKPANAHMMSVGAFDDSSMFHMSSEIFIDDKPEGYAFAGEHPRLTAQETIAKFVKR